MDRQPMEAVCRDCKHRWTFAYTPIHLDGLCEILEGVRCPMCASKDVGVLAQETSNNAES